MVSGFSDSPFFLRVVSGDEKANPECSGRPSFFWNQGIPVTKRLTIRRPWLTKCLFGCFFFKKCRLGLEVVSYGHEDAHIGSIGSMGGLCIFTYMKTIIIK